MTDSNQKDPAGVLLVDKPVDWTSHDVVNCVRRRFRLRKVGHCGTLDPQATGLLVLVLGRATKLSQNFIDTDKVYSGTMRLGQETTTQDSEGEVTAEKDYTGVTEEQVRAAMAAYVGEIWQTPPMVSALKKGGKRLYKLARQGKTVEREPRRLLIHKFELKSFTPPDIEFILDCSKGTYVRTICADVGADLGCGAYLHDLRRTAAGEFSVEKAYTTDTIKTWEREDLVRHMMPLERVLTYL